MAQNAELYLTYCSRRKRKAPGLLPARARYLSARIRAVEKLAEHAGVAFRIFSGRYGLIAPTRRIPWYDHLLLPGEVSAMAKKLAPQLRGRARVTFWYAPDDYLAPYRAALRQAASRAGVRWRQLPWAPAKARCRGASRLRSGR